MGSTRRLVGVLLVLLSVGLLALDYAALSLPRGITGMVLDATPRGSRVAVVRRDGAAAAAGVRAGDIIDVRALSYAERLRLAGGTVPGHVMQLRVAHANSPFRDVAIVTRPSPSLIRALAGRLSGGLTAQLIASAVTASIGFGIAALIGWRRPSLAAAALVFAAAGPIPSLRAVTAFAGLPDPMFAALGWGTITLFGQFPSYALLVFLAWFPHPPATAGERRRAVWAVGMCAAALIFDGVVTAFSPYLPGISSNAAAPWTPWIASVVVIGFTLICYASAGGDARRRIGWVLTGVALTTAGLTMHNIIYAQASPSLSADARAWLFAAGDVLQASVFVALAYAVLRHRVLDVGFVLNRTLVYGTVTTFVVVVIALVDWACGQLLSASKFALAFEAMVAVALGLVLNRLHNAIERLVDRVVFRHRHLAEMRIHQRAAALAFAQDAAEIDGTLAVDAAKILALASGAVFRRDDDVPGRFRRVAGYGWGDADAMTVDGGSILARSMHAAAGALVLADLAIDHPQFPRESARPALALPIVFQAELVGFALYGSRADGTLPDPEEIALLRHLTAAAAGVYEIVELRQWRRSVLARRAMPIP